jgi:DNA-binding NarL/FixJ family response regulator
MHGEIAASCQAIAAAIPNARLVLLEAKRWMSELYTIDGSEPPLVRAVDDFLASLQLDEPASPAGEHPASATEHHLTAREREVLRLIAEGKSNREIADYLVLSVRTVERHIANAYAKIGARGRADATAYALRHHLD